MHARGDGDATFHDVVAPIHLTTTFRQTVLGGEPHFDYSRAGNPTRELLETHVAALEGGSYGYAFSSGMAAITAVLSLFKPGDEVLVPNNIYGGTYRVLEHYFKNFNIGYRIVDVTDTAAVDAAFGDKTVALLFESPTNPLLTVADIAALSQIAHKHDALSIVDNTFLTPYLQLPLALGADIVIHSATKYLGGHSDVIAGLVVLNNAELAERVFFILKSTGGMLSPFDSYLLLRGIKTLAVRIDRQISNALALAHWLVEQPQVERVYYPALKSHPGYRIQAAQAKGGGGLLSFDLIEGASPQRFFDALQLVVLAESLGAVESLVCHPATMTHASIPAKLRAEMGITSQLIRLSVGIEHIDDLKADLARGFANLPA
jgi:cystathionine beta-lyase/cystathionine gamma-synthase